MYDSSMKSATYPLAVPSDLLGEVRKAAQLTGLSMADTMRQSIKMGLPKLVEQLSPDPRKDIKPFTEEECQQCWGAGSADVEFDALAAHCAQLPAPLTGSEE